MKALSVLFGGSFVLCACGSVEDIAGNQPIVDLKGVDLARYESDLQECRDYADQVDGAAKTSSAAAAGAATGAVVGAVLGDGDSAARYAGVGAATGTLKGVSATVAERRQVLDNCLNNRGYVVLN